MRNSILLITLILFFTSCKENTNKQPNEEQVVEETNATQQKTYCYYRTEGNNNEDSSLIKLVIDGDNVTGEMKYLPYEKDASVGTVEGTKGENNIQLKWTYYQEGMEATELVSLKIEIDGVQQQEVPYNATGKQSFQENAPYLYKYQQMDCDKFPERNF